MLVADYRCLDCGERYPFMYDACPDRLIGGITSPKMASHGPGLRCLGQTFDRVTIPKEVTEK